MLFAGVLLQTHQNMENMVFKSNIEILVFTETNLGTCIAIPVTPDITVGIFKGELQRAHFNNFPNIGSLSIDAVMVKQDPYFYHLSDLMPLKHVFKGLQCTWLLHAKASLLNNLSEINNGAKVGQTRRKRKRKRKRKPKVKKIANNLSCEKLEQESLEQRENYSSVYERGDNCPQQVLHPCTISDTAAAESPCGSASVSGIISRYFSNLVNIDDSASSSEITPSTAKCDVDKCSSSKKESKRRSSQRTRQSLLPSPLPEDSNSVALKNKYERSEVGKRLVVASNKLSSSQKSAKSMARKLCGSDAGLIIRNLVFEIDNDE